MTENYSAGSTVRVKRFDPPKLNDTWGGVEGLVIEDGYKADINGHKVKVTVDPFGAGTRVGMTFILHNLELIEGTVIPDKPEVDEAVEHPAHYGGADNPYEVIKVIEAWGLGFVLGNVVKYVARAGKKPGNSEVQDLKKARDYINRRIEQLEKN
ncbi:hypothetical protein SEA_MOLIVIA_54 [Arthrobacter phage Molivia]|uniref:DUF3310 domain-containing protein n=1 Tax=Arthrobacter phage Molivia TaxID=2015839 RepID=A0A286S1S0_9CAUD|nr:kinase [Arthrobacter phage Molivia]ASX99278.1 hypothetical protein SEA_MOLIVIA_54 [Arthrobacter phage Molivia]